MAAADASVGSNRTAFERPSQRGKFRLAPPVIWILDFDPAAPARCRTGSRSAPSGVVRIVNRAKKRGHPETLIVPHPSNTNAVKSGIYSPRLQARRAEEIAALMEGQSTLEAAEEAGGDAAKEALAGLAGAGEHDEQLLLG